MYIFVFLCMVVDLKSYFSHQIWKKGHEKSCCDLDPAPLAPSEPNCLLTVQPEDFSQLCLNPEVKEATMLLVCNSGGIDLESTLYWPVVI